MNLLLQRRELISKVWDYELHDQTYDGTNYTITPLMLYTAENITKNCKIAMKVDNIQQAAFGTFFSTMYEVSPYPGMVLRLANGAGYYLNFAGKGSLKLTQTMPSDFVIEFERNGSTGVWTAQFNNNSYTTTFGNTQFTQALTIGTAYQGNQTSFFRYGKFHLDYFKFKWL